MSNYHWMLKHSSKMDTLLKRRLLDSYGKQRKFPCFLQKYTRWVLERATKVSVVIQLHEGMATESIEDVKAMTKKRGFSKTQHLPLINGMTAKLTMRDLQKVCESGAIAKIHLDREFKTMLDTATPAVGSKAAQANGITGRGVTVAVVDTGIYPHPDLQGRIIGFKDFVGGKTAPYDDNGHGTHCAGDVASNGSKSDGKYAGTAPEARLVGVKVLSKQGTGSLSTVIQGIDWCVQNREKYGIRVISMSLGSTAQTPAADDPVVQAVERAWRAGIVVCVAAGNEGPAKGSIASPGIAPSVITVGAADDKNTVRQADDRVADFSSRGPTIDGLVKPDVVAPGVNIISLRSPRSNIDKTHPSSRVGEWYFNMSGTSMATPIVAGLVAQILQLNSTLTPNQVKDIIKRNAVSLGDIPNNQGKGEIHFPSEFTLKEKDK